MCIERFLEAVKRLLAKHKKLTVHNDLFSAPTGRIKNKAGPINAENLSCRINKVPSLWISPHIDGHRLYACRCDSLHGYDSDRL